MRVERITLIQLILFFSKNQDALPLIVQSPSDSDVWERIFVFFYGELPIQVPSESYPLQRRPGSTDPRWDELLHGKKAIRAMNLFLQNRLVIHTCKEAT